MLGQKSTQNFYKLLIIYALLAPWTTTSAMEQWDYHFKKAELQFSGERYVFARENYARALEMKPDLYKAANRLAETHLILNQKREALEYLRVSLKIRDEQPGIHTAAGELCEFFGYGAESYFHHTRAVKLDPGNVRAHFNLVRHYIAAGDKASADRHFSICYEAGIKEGGPLFERGVRAESEGELNEAVAAYTAALEKNPAHVEAYFKLVELHRRRGETDRAIAVLEKLKKVRPDHQRACRYLGHLYFVRPPKKNRRKYDLQQAVKNLSRALELDPADQDARFLLSDVYRHVGDIEKAREVQNLP
ncbi:MAG TPA: tetratricopeptide repeat protein [Spirochaetes bacterium]|nr:tetratricopeptide repeat protein [Spirochaetota bacterium]